MKECRVIVCQKGARRRYAVPRMLEKAGLLSALYTDSSASSFIGRIASYWKSSMFEKVNRLAERKIKDIPAFRIFSSDIILYNDFTNKILNKQETTVEKRQRQDDLISLRMKKWGWRDANVVYSMYNEQLEFLKWIKQKGLKIVLDVYENPLAEGIIAEELSNYPIAYQESAKSQEEISYGNQLWSEAEGLADRLICPSKYVADGVTTLNPRSAEKVSIVPYGSSICFEGKVNNPILGRILFVGNNAARKGLCYFASAIQNLKRHSSDIDARVVGDFPDEITKDDQFNDLNFIGKLNSSKLIQEYLLADVFVLPSLSEGFAAVVAEAICAGCPVVVTKECGSPVENKREGVIVPAKSIVPLASAISKLLTDRKLREQCSKNCISQRGFYSEAAWQKRLVTSLEIVTRC